MISGKANNALKYFLGLTILILSLIINGACSNTTEPNDENLADSSNTIITDDTTKIVQPPYNIPMKNIQWNLKSVQDISNSIDINDYEPFFFVIRDEFIFANDNCNNFHGDYLLESDSLELINGSWTEIGCEFLNYFSFHHLFNKTEIIIENGDLIRRNDTIGYVYESNFTENFDNLDFGNENYILLNSNDTGYSQFDSLGYRLELIISKDRVFDLIWYKKEPASSNRVYRYKGVIGFNCSDEVLFTPMSYNFTNTNSPNNNSTLIFRILQCDLFEYDFETLSLLNTDANTFYKFKP